ncbi:unnamed protein product [Rhizophagus irregularis]|nr:unnamed protein product [Rhizophagus irregularis]
MGELLIHHQGKHTKLESLLNDENFKEECQAWLRQQKPESRTPGNLKVYIEGMVFPKLTGHIKKDTISEKTCQNYMYLWGYKLLQLSDEQMRKNPHIKSKEAFILRSVQTDGYWKSKHMLDQLVHQAIPIFEILHPGCVGVFCFDQSTNHNAMAADALIVVRMNLSPGGTQPKMRDGWYINENGEKLVHSMVFPDNHKLKEKPKGIKQVLTERNIWPEKGIRLMCEQCSGKQDDIDSERLDC